MIPEDYKTKAPDPVSINRSDSGGRINGQDRYTTDFLINDSTSNTKTGKDKRQSNQHNNKTASNNPPWAWNLKRMVFHF